MQISINITPESPEDLARVFAFLSGRDGVELAPLDAAAVAKASAEENAAAEAEVAKPAPKKARKKPAKKPEPKPEPVVEDRKQIELDLRAFAAEHGMSDLRDALKAAELPRLQDAADEDLPKFRAVLDQLADGKGTELS
jgi:hypothetical protein